MTDTTGTAICGTIIGISTTITGALMLGEPTFARDRARLDENIRLDRQAAASRDAADLARHQRALRPELRDIHRDRRDIQGDYRYSWR